MAIKLAERHREILDSYFGPIFYVEPNPPSEYIRFLGAWIIIVELVLHNFAMVDSIVGLVGLDVLYARPRLDRFRELFSKHETRNLSRRFLMNGTGPYCVDLPTHYADLSSRCIAIMYVNNCYRTGLNIDITTVPRRD